MFNILGQKGIASWLLSKESEPHQKYFFNIWYREVATWVSACNKKSDHIAMVS